VKLFYKRIEHNTILELLSNDDISSSLAYLVSFENHHELNVVPKDFSIEISNDKITIAVILFVGFEIEEYEALKHRKNLHIVTFSEVVSGMVEFEKLGVKYIDNLSLLFTVLSRSKDHLARYLYRLKNFKD
jgi:hypothetical protein